MQNQPEPVLLDGRSLTAEAVIAIAVDHQPVAFAAGIAERIQADRTRLEAQLSSHPEVPIYGCNTGVGNLKDTTVGNVDVADYQRRYIRSHNCGTGNPISEEAARAMMIIRLNSFAKGMSGMSLSTCQIMIDMLNKGVTPWVLEEGSVGASGDLVPLAMVGAVLIGLPEAKAYYKGELLSAPEALAKAGLQPVKLGAKEAMGITNGSNFISGLAVLALRDAEILLETASVAAALSLEAIRGEQRAFSSLINEMSDRHEGQLVIAKKIRDLIEGSQRMTKAAQEFEEFNHKALNKERVQDRYSFRCVPQVHGTVWTALRHFREILTTELNAATDNPLFDFSITDENGFLHYASGGNFHGQPLASVIDYVKINLTTLGLISDKRTFSLLDERLSYGLPKDLSTDITKGNSGYLLTQYAGAARAAENRVLASPSSITSISTSANQEDFVSMGASGILHLHKILHNVTVLLSVEILCAFRALQMTRDWLPEHLRTLGQGTQKVYEILEKQFPPLEEDTYVRLEMEAVMEIVRSGKLLG